MSRTNLQIIESALRELVLLDETQSATAAQGTTGLTYLNQMMEEWTQTDHNLNFAPQDTLSDVCPIPAWAELAVITNLAILLASPMAVPIPPIVAARADRSMRIMTRALITQKLKKADMSILPQGEGKRLFDINTGTIT
jgi:hypothetical protein